MIVVDGFALMVPMVAVSQGSDEEASLAPVKHLFSCGLMVMKKIFLDVGAHAGETLQEVSGENYLFDEIHCFEPMPQPCAVMKDWLENAGAKPISGDPDIFSLAGKKIILNPFGLGRKTEGRVIYGSGIGASLYDGERVRQIDRSGFDKAQKTSCRFIAASDYFREHISRDDMIVAKMNCEGAEIEILEHLLASGEIFKIDNAMIDFDARKIKSMEHLPHALLKKFRKAGFKNYSLRFEVMRKLPGSKHGTHQGRIRNWLESLPFANLIMKSPTPFRGRRLLYYWFLRYVRRPFTTRNF